MPKTIAEIQAEQNEKERSEEVESEIQHVESADLDYQSNFDATALGQLDENIVVNLTHEDVAEYLGSES